MARWDRTHDALTRAASELFAEQGYAATGTAQIAARAGVSEMTLFRHFATKESLLLADPFDPLMAEAVRSRPADEQPMCALVEGIRQAWADTDPAATDALRGRLAIIAETPDLQGAIERTSQDSVAALIEALSERGVPSARARVAATAVIAGLSAALLDWARSDGTALDDVLGAALDVLGGA